MVLTTHLLTGAAIVYKIKPLGLALFLAFLSHYLLDFLPHPAEYSIKNIREKKWRQSGPEFIKIALDLLIGFLIIFFLIGLKPMVYLGAFLAILPDGLIFLNLILNNRFLQSNNQLHFKIHFLKKYPISLIIRYLTEFFILSTAFFFLFY